MEQPRGLAWVYGAHGLIHANMIVFPTVLTLVRKDLGESWFLLGALATASSMAFGLLGLPAGILTDRFGARRVVLLSLGGSAAACLAAGLSPGLLSLGAALVLLGACGGFYHPSALTLITTSMLKSGRSLGMHGVGGNLGMAVAPLALAGLASLAGWHAAFLAMAAAGGAFTLAASRGLPRPAIQAGASGQMGEPLEPVAQASPPRAERTQTQTQTQTKERSWSTSSVVAPLLLTYAIILTLGFVYNGFIAFLPAYLADRAPGSIEGVAAGGALTTVVLLMGMMGQWWGGYMSDIGRARPAYLAAALTVAVAGAAMWGLSGWGLVLAAGVLSVLLFSGQPMGNSLLAELTSPHRRGLVFGMSFTLSFGVGSLATGAMGYIADRGGLELVFLALGVSAAPAVIAAAFLVAGARRGTSPRDREDQKQNDCEDAVGTTEMEAQR